MEWQTIETRPLKGNFLVYGRQDEDEFVCAVSHNYGTEVDDLCAYSAFNEPLAFTPSHWMPLPQPPNS